MASKPEYVWIDRYSSQIACQHEHAHRSPTTALKCPVVRRRGRVLDLKRFVQNAVHPGTWDRIKLTKAEHAEYRKAHSRAFKGVPWSAAP